MPKLLLIDDDTELCDMMHDYLTGEGFALTCATTAAEGLDFIRSQPFDLVLLDILLPDASGLEVLRRVRSESVQPILMLTGRGDEIDRVVGLEMGADDYLPKPFIPRELVARIRAILRRTMTGGMQGAVPERFEAEDIALNTGTREAVKSGRLLNLTGAEFGILELLMRSAGRPVSREDMSQSVLGRELSPYDRSVDVHMSNLRKKLGSRPDGSARIRTVRGIGYQLVLPHLGARKAATSDRRAAHENAA